MKGAGHQYEDKLLEFAYGELPDSEATAVDAHVRGCSRCAEALAQINAVRGVMRALPAEPAPDAGLESLLAYAEQTAKRNAGGRPRDAWWRRLLMPLASAAALLVVGVVAWRASRDFDPDPGLLALKQAAPAAAAPQPGVARRKDIAADEAKAASAKVVDDGYGAEPSGPGEAADGKLAPPPPAAPPPRAALERDAMNTAGDSSRVRAKPPSASLGAGPAPLDTASPNQRAAGNEPLWGLTGRGSAPPEPGPAGGSAEDLGDVKQDKAKELVAAPPAQVPPRAAVGKKESLSLGSLTTASEVPARREAALADAEGTNAAAPEAEPQQYRGTGGRAALAAEAKGAGPSGLEAALAALQAGVTGSARAEALERLCEGYEARGQEALARPSCDALVAEFPRTAAAQAVVQRRAQRSTPAAGKAPSSPAPPPPSKKKRPPPDLLKAY